MSGTRGSINIFVPNVCPFPELAAVGAGYRQPEPTLPTPMTPLVADKTVPSAVAEAAAAAMVEEGSGRSLYVYDSQGRLLEHVRYQGSDYRSALRAAINATPSRWKE